MKRSLYIHGWVIGFLMALLAVAWQAVQAQTPVVTLCPNPTVGGTTTYLGGPLCSVSNAGSLTLTGQVGTVVTWQTSTNGGSTWTGISGTFGKNNYNFVNAANGQQYRAMLNNEGSCADAFSTPVTISTSPTACSSATCDKSSGTVVFTTTLASTGSNYSNVVIMTDGNGIIQYASAPGSSTLTGVAAGNYLVYLVSYDNTQKPLPILTAGTNLTAVGGACVVYSAQLAVKVCPPAPAFAFSCANASVSGAFVANSTAGQTGSLNLPITVTTPGSVTLLVSGTDFQSSPTSFTTTLTAGQTSLSVPIVYAGTGTAGTRTLTVTSANATGTCSPTVVVGAPDVPCTPVQPGIASASAASIQTGQVASFSLGQFLPASAAVTWTIVPSAGVSQASGTGTSTGNITFLTAGNYSILYNIVNSSVPVGCNLSTNSFATAYLLVTSPPTLCQTPSPGIATIAPSSAAIPVNGTASVGLTGGTPNTSISWKVIPSAGVSQAAGVGVSTGTLTFTEPGLYKVVYTIYNAGDGTCLPVQNTTEALISVGLNPCSQPSTITIVSSVANNTSVSGNPVTFTAVGGLSGAMSWTVTPGSGGSPAMGSGNVATVNFSQTGEYVITFISSNSSTPVGCTAPALVSSSLSHSVVAPKLPPIATSDIANTNPNTTVPGNVLTNDVDPQAGLLTASLISQPTAGTVTLNANGSYTYTPPASFTGVATFCYSVSNTAGLSSSACVTVNVNPDPSLSANDRPIANYDNTQTTVGMSVTINVAANDTDPDSATSPDGQLNPPTIVSQPTLGAATSNSDGTLKYTPPAGFTGVVSFPYQICDKATTPLCATALVTINVQPTPPVNTTLAPVAVDDALLTSVNTPTSGTVSANDSDPQGLSLTYTTGQPTSGTAVMSPTGSYTYTPASDYTGPASFTYSVCNSAGKCNVATVSVLVQQPAGLLLLPKAWLQGALFGVTDASGIMRDDLRSKGYLPLSSPYTSFTALTSTPALSSSAVFATTGNNAIVDWIFVELRSPTSASTVVDSRAALIQRDGDIVELDGVSPMVFSKASPGTYYVSVRHRNHLGAMTSTAIPLSVTGTVVDFRIADSTRYYRATASAINQAQVTVAQGVALWAGNVLYDKTVIYQSTNNDVAAISVQVKTARKPDGTLFNITGAALYTLKGYYTGDANLDGDTIYQGTGNDVNYIFLNVTKNHKGNPTGSNLFIIKEQLP